MVAKITTPASILRALNYNEKKVEKGYAACISATGFLLSAKALNFHQKLERFKSLIELNTRARTNTLHISLNFDPRENISKEKLCQIASAYMSGIGFGDQPFLVYQHFDAAHPHMHIVTTTIRENGKRIDTFNIGKIQSERTRKEVEETFGLIKAAGKKEQVNEGLRTVTVQKTRYGVTETRRSMANVLDFVVNQYRFTSLPELNAVLNLYNIVEDQGQAESRTYRNGGLYYRLLDEDGNRVGVPVKASSIYFKPTLRFLQEKFKQNEPLRHPFRRKLKIAIDWTLAKKPTDISEFIRHLKKEHVTAVLRENSQGIIYGITFIDHGNRTVFNGSNLGKLYSVAGLKERIERGMQGVSVMKESPRDFTEKSMSENQIVGRSKVRENDQQDGQNAALAKGDLWELLMNKEKTDLRLPFDLIRKKKKRRLPNYKTEIMSSTGEDEKGLKQILDITRFAAIVLLFVHFYYYCYAAFKEWGLAADIGDRFLHNIYRTGLFESMNRSKLIALGLLLISVMGVRGRKDEKVRGSSIFIFLVTGCSLYFFSHLLLRIHSNPSAVAASYMAVTIIGFILILTAGGLLTRCIHLRLQTDIFNELNETFPQEERLIENEYSINLPARYKLKGKLRASWINFINPFRGLLVLGSPGAGKSYFVIQHVIRQHLRKGFSMLVYDFKYDDLTKISYNTLFRSKNTKLKRGFFVINFDDLSRSHRCNPLDPHSMMDITDATESSRSILLGLNKDWITKQGDFFVESPINFLTAVIWFLKKYKDGKYCTLPHVIELMQIEYEKLFPVLRMEKEIEVLINPFISAYQNRAMEQLEGQIASAKIGMARLSSPQLYWVLSGNDFTLDINNPAEPKVLCLANKPQKQQIFGAVLSLYVNRVIKLVNQKGRTKCSLVFDEFPTIFINGIDSLIATGRSNKIATCLGMQDFSQLRKDYGTQQATVIVNIAGNVISGQVAGETAKSLSERFGRIVQVKESVSINRDDTSVSKSAQLDYAVPASKIAGLSSGEFVGMVADDPQEKIKLKAFHCEVVNDHEALRQERKSFSELPVISSVSQEMILENYFAIKRQVDELIETEIEILLNTPG